MFVNNSVIYIWGGFQNNTLKDILLLYIIWLIHQNIRLANRLLRFDFQVLGWRVLRHFFFYLSLFLFSNCIFFTNYNYINWTSQWKYIGSLNVRKLVITYYFLFHPKTKNEEENENEVAKPVLNNFLIQSIFTAQALVQTTFRKQIFNFTDRTNLYFINFKYKNTCLHSILHSTHHNLSI